jgi:hypothetical protein
VAITMFGEEFIYLLEIIALIGFSFLSCFTLVSYSKLKSKLLLFIALAFTVMSLSLILSLFFLDYLISITSIEGPYLESIIEGMQFLAAFLFFYGLKLLKTNKKSEEISK